MNRYSTQSRRRSAQPPAPPPATISILIPFQQLACPLVECKTAGPGAGRGPWKGPNCHNNLRIHYVKSHAQPGSGVKLRFICSICQHRFECIQPANKHFKDKHAGTSASQGRIQKYNSAKIESNKLIIQHPAGPTSCPIRSCEWASCATDKNVATSIEKHLYIKHQIETSARLWFCGDCDAIEAGHDMRFHKKKRCPMKDMPPSLPASIKPAADHLNTSNIATQQVDPVIILLGSEQVNSPPQPTNPSVTCGEDFASFCDSDDCTPMSPRRGLGFRPSSSSSPVTAASELVAAAPVTKPADSTVDVSSPPLGLDAAAALPDVDQSDALMHSNDCVSSVSPGHAESRTFFSTNWAGSDAFPIGHDSPSRAAGYTATDLEAIKMTDGHEALPAPYASLTNSQPTTGTPDIDARSNESAGWSPHFINRQEIKIMGTMWPSGPGLLPINDSIWSVSTGDESRNETKAATSIHNEPVPPWKYTLNVINETSYQNVQDLAKKDENCMNSATNNEPAESCLSQSPLSDTSMSCANESGDLADFESLASDTQLETIGYSDKKQNLFFHTWASAFNACSSRSDLDSTVTRCMADWLVKTRRNLEQLPVDCPTNSKSRKRTRRRPDRQLQRLSQRDNRNADEAKKIQVMFKIYPKRAVRRALGESSAKYDGTTEDARNFLSATYERSPPSHSERVAARTLFDSCQWLRPDDDTSGYLDGPPTKCEIERKLSRATNTAPGADGIEYRHLRALDPSGLVLESMYNAVWRIGIPAAWKQSRTVPIHKKGPTNDFSNFRPISLLSTAYKIFSGILNDRLCQTATQLSWLSKEQKGFLPGVNGVAEHTQLLQTAIEHSKEKKKTLLIAWLDLRNAFGSIPHVYLQELFHSLPIPAQIRSIMMDIYADNIMQFVTGDETTVINPTAGVRQGDALSTTVFNLAAEPIIRAAKSQINAGYECFHETIKTSAFADDIAVIADSTLSMQRTLDRVSAVARLLSLEFNADKCACLMHSKGRNNLATLLVQGQPIRMLGKEDKENYLGIPLGSKLRFRTATDLPDKLDRLAASKLAPWQKLEVLRSHLLPSLSHDLASGRALKSDLVALDLKCRKFMCLVTGVPHTAVTAFFYAERSSGGLGLSRLVDDADIWVIARACQLLCSKDPTLKNICWFQLQDTIARGFGNEPIANFPYSSFLSGDRTTRGLYRLRFAGKFSNLWTLARRAAMRRKTRIEVSNDRTIRIIADVFSAEPCKAVRSLRAAVRSRWTKVFMGAPHQGQVANRLGLVAPRDIVRLTSARTTLSHDDYLLVHRVRLDVLPLVGYHWVNQRTSDKCRACRLDRENAQHLLNNCKLYMQLARERHNAIVTLLKDLLVKSGKCDQIAVERQLPGFNLRPDIQGSVAGSNFLIDVTVAFDSAQKMDAAHETKTAKYGAHGQTFPIVVGSLGSWNERNDDLRQFLGIDGRRWAKFRLLARTAAIAGSMSIIRSHLILTRWEATGSDWLDAATRPECDPSRKDEYFCSQPFYDPFDETCSLDNEDGLTEQADLESN